VCCPKEGPKKGHLIPNKQSEESHGKLRPNTRDEGTTFKNREHEGKRKSKGVASACNKSYGGRDRDLVAEQRKKKRDGDSKPKPPITGGEIKRAKGVGKKMTRQCGIEGSEE